MVINMLTADYEQAYISSFAKVNAVLNYEYETHINVINMNEEEQEKNNDNNLQDINYEIELKKINGEEINGYISVCFQKENGALTVIADKKIDEEITKKVVKDVSLALNEEPLASYNFKNLKVFIIYHFVYVKENITVDNKKILEELKALDQIENLNYEINLDNKIYK